MTTLRVIVDDIVARVPGALGRYAEDLTRAVIATAPRGADVDGFVSSSPEGSYAELREKLPGLHDLHKSALARRELSAAWQHGFTVLPGSGMVHATSLLAPLRRHDRVSAPSEQTVVTFHDAIAWTNPELLPARAVSWQHAMAKRAARFADAVVVPTHAVADVLTEHLDLADRIRVISPGPSTAFAVPGDAADRRTRLSLPERYVLAVDDDGRLDTTRLAEIATHSAARGAHLVLASAASNIEARDGLTVISSASDPDRAAALEGATLVLHADAIGGSGSALIDSLAFGKPIVMSDDPALAEIAAGAGRVVPSDAESVENFAAAIAELLVDQESADRLAIAAEDRAKAFTWRDAAEKVWQLHADL